MLKNHWFFNDFARSGVWCTMEFWMKKLLKNEVEYRHWLWFDFGLIFRPFLEPKSLQNRFRSGFRRALNEDSVSKLQKERAGLSSGVQTGRNLGSGKGEQGRGFNYPHTPDNLSRDRVGGFITIKKYIIFGNENIVKKAFLHKHWVESLAGASG